MNCLQKYVFKNKIRENQTNLGPWKDNCVSINNHLLHFYSYIYNYILSISLNARMNLKIYFFLTNISWGQSSMTLTATENFR